MKITLGYSVRANGNNKAFEETAAKYREAVLFFKDVALEHWDAIAKVVSVYGTERRSFVETLTIRTKKRPDVPHPFGVDFYKFPSYLRRAAITEALGLVSSYKSNLANWEEADPATRGEKPGLPTVGCVFPALYQGNCFIRTGTYKAKLKVWTRNTWDWEEVKLRKCDVDYIIDHCSDMTELSPTLRRRGKVWSLDFAYEKKQDLNETPLEKQVVLAVDLGINSSCVCSAMTLDGTILRRYFFSLPREEDCLCHRLGKISRANRGGMKPAFTHAEWEAIKKLKHRPLELRNVGGGSRHMPRLWAFAKNMNRHIAEETARAIIRFAEDCHADVIVFERLDLNGKKKGGRKFRLHLWKARDIQKMVERKAHLLGMHISRVCARNTSKLAFDGSGEVERGVDGNYSICKFPSGKVYNCDLSASYNIGARYFIRETLREIPSKVGSAISAKVPGCAKRSTATLSSLISMNAELRALVL